MLAATTTSLEHVALDGPVELSTAVLVGLGLLALFGWSLWRERNILGRAGTIFFWLLRAVTLATVIWMLLAPSRIRVETSTTRRTLAIVTDASASMRTVDSGGATDDWRWAVTLSESNRGNITSSADRAVAAAGIARRDLERTTRLLDQHAPEAEVVSATNATNHAIERVRLHLQNIVDAGSTSGRARTLARRLLETLDGSEFQNFSKLANDLRRGRRPDEKGWRESLPDLELRLSSLGRSLHELARYAAEEETLRLAENAEGSLAEVRNESRFGRAERLVGKLAQDVLRSFEEEADIEIGTFENELHSTRAGGLEHGIESVFSANREAPAGSQGTDLANVLEQLGRERQEQPLAAVFLLTDAAHNNPDSDPREEAAVLGDTPVYVVPIGNTEHVRDIDLRSVHAPSVALRNDDVVIEARIQAYDCQDEVCVVQLLQDGEVIDFREVLLDAGLAHRDVRFEQQLSSVGNQTFQVAVAPLEGELTDENNYGEVTVNVTRSDIKVLLADELPRWEYRYLAQLFRRDPKIECDELLFHPRMIATGRRAKSQTFPVTVDEWDQYDVILLGDVPPEHLPAASQESLIEYLKRRSGTLILIAGHEAMPQRYVDHSLRDILPVESLDRRDAHPNGYAFRVTAEGRDHVALMIGETEEATRTAWDFVNRFSPLYSVSPWRKPLPTARTLIAAVPRDSLDEESDAATSAFLCWQPVGRGRVVYLSGPDTYRLRFLRGDRLHYRFWGQLMRWAIASDLSDGTEWVRIRSDRTRYDSRDDVHLTVRLQDRDGEPVVTDSVVVSLQSGDDEQTAELSANADVPGEYHGTVTALAPGVYRVEPIGDVVAELQEASELEPASTSFTVQADIPMELVDTRCDRALAQQIADLTGGQVLPPTAIAEIIELTNLEPIVSERMETRPLWIEWKYLWIVFGCLQTEWILRKWKGLS